MSRGTTLSSLKDLESAEIEIHRTVETIDPRDENIVNNRVFVWNFERDDLNEFINYFKIYRNMQINADSRQKLNGRLNSKINAMLNEGYIPIECMLYASKAINNKLRNDRELENILAERIREVYVKKTYECIEVFKNILEKWTWEPQLRVVISAIGLIGDNEELLDKIFQRFSTHDQFKVAVFYAFLKNKTVANLERAMKMIMALQEDVPTDQQIGNIFKKEFFKFGDFGTKALEKYADNPGISKFGKRILRQITIRTGVSNETDSVVASKSKEDGDAYLEFLAFCETTGNKDQAAFLCRFSRPDIAKDFLIDFLRKDTTSDSERQTGLISMAYLKANGFSDAKEIVREFKSNDNCRNGYLMAMLILHDIEASRNIVDILSQEHDYKLQDFYRRLINADIKNNAGALRLLQQEIQSRLYNLLRSNDNPASLDILTENMKGFWKRKISYLLSEACLKTITAALADYSQDSINLDENVVISLIAIRKNHHYNDEFEKILFKLYEHKDNPKLRNFIYQILKSRDTGAPV